jgi:putative peptidoglycan lipid II flippase
VTATGMADVPPRPLDGGSDLIAPEAAVSDSMSVAIWTVISRLSGVLRGVTIAAVLGATYFANTYQFTNSLPNLVFYGLLAGSMFSSLLVPALVQHIDSGDRLLAARTAGGLLGMAMLGMLAVVPAVAAATPWLLRLGSAGTISGVAAQEQFRTGAVLVLLLLPQVPLYAVVGTAAAVMNAHRRFALAAAAPALENLGTIAVLGAAAALYSQAAAKRDVPLSLLLLLGLGTTGAVMLHAAVQWWGARRLGIVLVPNAGWRDPAVRATIRRALPAVAHAGLSAVQFGALLLFADRVAGGVVAFLLATNFYFLPIALGAQPVAFSLVPRLSRLTAPSQAELFRDTYIRGLLFAAFLVVPAATAYVVLARPLAAALGFGAFGAGGGQRLVASALLGLAPALIGEALFLLTTYACYARKDTIHPLRAMVVQAAVCAAGLAGVAHARGPSLLTYLGLAFSAGAIAAAGYLVRHLRRGMPRGGEPALRPLLRTVTCSGIMAVPAWALADLLARQLTGVPGRVAAIVLVSVAGAAIYFTAQACMRAPQIQWVSGALLGYRRRLAERVSTLSRSGAFRTSLWRRRRLVADEALHALLPVLRKRRIDIALLLCPLGIGALAAIDVKYAVVVVMATGLVIWVMARPVVAAYLLIFLTPLVVGISAGTVVPLLRPNEALVVLLGAAIGLRWLARVRTGAMRWPRIGRIDLCLVAVGAASSVLPLMMMVVRQRPISTDDLLYSTVIWKLMAEYVIVRTVIKTRDQAMRCLVLSLLAAAIVCAVGVMQVLRIANVAGFLAKYYSPVGMDPLSPGRGGSLLGMAAATGDLAILSLAIVVAMIVRDHPRRLWLAGLAVLYALGVLATGEFSSVIGLAVALVALMILTRAGKIAVYAIPVALFGGAVLWPVIQGRLSGFHSPSGLPQSWLDRLYNLRTYFWPSLFSDHNWILGVRPSARVAVPSKSDGYVWIESGYSWLLWGGGIPLLASYLAFAALVIRKGWACARRPDAAGIAATAVTTAMCSQVVLMFLDPHLTYRGSGDALFLVLALVRGLPGQHTSAEKANQVDAVAATGQLLGVPA